ncbi:toll-like receptor 6 isoform X2 [Mercenaria mercenaria]|nr:toll-like receptor 6 isoform X2 [Mercenaria mercenaria]
MQQQMKMRSITYTMITAFAVIFVFCLNLTNQTCIPSDKDTVTVVCDNIVPVILPSNITQVYIHIYSLDIHFSGRSFSHKSWQTVAALDINARYKNEYGGITVTFGSMCFSKLYALKELRIQGVEINGFHLYSFHKLEHLQKLRFFECSYLNINSVIAALSHANITVDILVLEDVSSANTDKLSINENFYDLLQKMKVTSLSLRKTIFKINQFQPRQMKTSGLTTLDVSQTTYMFPNHVDLLTLHNIFTSFFQGLKTLNISAIPVQFFLPDKDFLNNRIIRKCDELRQGFIQFFLLRLKNLYSNTLFRSPVIMNNTILNISDCHFNLKKWQFKENNVQYFNISIILPQNNALTEVDLSNNEMEYISPLALQNAHALEILKLTSNKLFQMESLPDFKDLLLSNTALKHVCLAENKISNMPRDIFRNNAALEIIDLADNHLKSVTFTLTHLERLKSLNIARNRIKFIEDKPLTDIQLLFKTRASAGSNQTTIIEMSGNPFECSCDSVRFMEWVIFLKQYTKRTYRCSMESEEAEINKDSLRNSKIWLCYRDVIIPGASTGGLILLAGIIILIICICRRKRKQKQKFERKRFLKDFKKGILKEQYLCQISYSSEDDACFLNTIYPKLNTTFEEILRCKREVICYGDNNFCLGRSIIDEILRCISESCVIIFVISKSFCASHWCEMELKEAHEMGKPIILLFKEEVNPDLMSRLLRTLFNRLTRAKLVEKDGLYELIPDWQSLGKSVIELAAKNYEVEQSI